MFSSNNKLTIAETKQEIRKHCESLKKTHPDQIMTIDYLIQLIELAPTVARIEELEQQIKKIEPLPTTKPILPPRPPKPKPLIKSTHSHLPKPEENLTDEDKQLTTLKTELKIKCKEILKDNFVFIPKGFHSLPLNELKIFKAPGDPESVAAEYNDFYCKAVFNEKCRRDVVNIIEKMNAIEQKTEVNDKVQNFLCQQNKRIKELDEILNRKDTKIHLLNQLSRTEQKLEESDLLNAPEKINKLYDKIKTNRINIQNQIAEINPEKENFFNTKLVLEQEIENQKSLIADLAESIEQRRLFLEKRQEYKDKFKLDKNNPEHLALWSSEVNGGLFGTGGVKINNKRIPTRIHNIMDILTKEYDDVTSLNKALEQARKHQPGYFNNPFSYLTRQPLTKSLYSEDLTTHPEIHLLKM